MYLKNINVCIFLFQQTIGNSCIHVSAFIQQAIHEHQKDKSTTTNATTTSAENIIPLKSLPCKWNKPEKGPVSYNRHAL